MDANESGDGVRGLCVVIGVALGIRIAGKGRGCASALTIDVGIFIAPFGAVIDGIIEFSIGLIGAVDHEYLIIKDGQAWAHTTKYTKYLGFFGAPTVAVIGAVIHTCVLVSTMSQEQIVSVGDKGGGIRRRAVWIIVSSPSCAVKDEVTKFMILAALVDQLQFLVENGYRAATDAGVHLISHLNHNVIVPSFARSVEGAVI